MNEFNLTEYRAKKEGIVTPLSLLTNALESVSDKEQVIVISIDNEGYIKTGWSDGGGVRTIGLLEVAKIQITDEMRE